MQKSISIILPARNESATIAQVIKGIHTHVPGAEILVIDDASTDDTATIATGSGARVISHRYRMGNGAAVKHGAREANGDIFVFMDADGQHDPGEIPALLKELESGYDMVVGARSHDSQASFARALANKTYNLLASWMVGRKVADLTSGFRAADAKRFREFLYLLPNGFSYPTTSTMAFFRAGYQVSYVPVRVHQRQDQQTSHIRPMRDGLRFLLIIFKVGSLYSPLKIFAPVSAVYFILGLSYYLYTYIAQGRFTNMSALLFTTAVLVFLIGLISEQITSLLYRPSH